MSSIDTAINVLAATPATLRALLAGLDEVALTVPGAEGWSARDVVAHVASLDPFTLRGRITAMIEQENPVIPGIDEEETLNASGLRGRPLAELLDAFAAQRALSMDLLRGLREGDLTRRGRHSVAGDLTVADIVHHKAFHDLLHTRQIISLIEAPIEAARGAMRIFV